MIIAVVTYLISLEMILTFYFFFAITVILQKQRQIRSMTRVWSLVVWKSIKDTQLVSSSCHFWIDTSLSALGKITRHLLTLIKADFPPEMLSHIYCTVMSHAQCQPFTFWQSKYTSLDRLQAGWHLKYNEQCHSKLPVNVKVNVWGAIWNLLLHWMLQYIAEHYLAVGNVYCKR